MLEESKTRFSFCEKLPRDTMRIITTFLTDDELFSIRSTNKTLHEAWQDQSVKEETIFNHNRALYFASRGFIFKHVIYLRVSSCRDYLQSINPHHFPKLKILHTSLVQIPVNPTVTTVIISLPGFEDLRAETFPNLLHAKILMPDPHGRVFVPCPHVNLRTITLSYFINWDDTSHKNLSAISRDSFPKLEQLTILEAHDDYRATQTLEIRRLREEGICVTEVHGSECSSTHWRLEQGDECYWSDWTTSGWEPSFSGYSISRS